MSFAYFKGQAEHISLITCSRMYVEWNFHFNEIKNVSNNIISFKFFYEKIMLSSMFGIVHIMHLIK
jgi:hypothetical protein